MSTPRTCRILDTVGNIILALGLLTVFIGLAVSPASVRLPDAHSAIAVIWVACLVVGLLIHFVSLIVLARSRGL